ncbi:MAG TPA: magnesium/cobalt transporter CorA [Aestuariivirgaceae bacterium]|jgi:magnesium transporter
MLNFYGVKNGGLTVEEASPGKAVSPDAIWFDLFAPTPEEEQVVENALGIDIPTREELAEIEASSRLYQEDGANFMTATLIRRADDGRAEAQPVTFILKDQWFVTVRYSEPRAFPVFVRRVMKPGNCPASSEGILMSLLEAVVDRAADHLESVALVIDKTSHEIFHTEASKRPRGRDFQELLRTIGEEGDFNSKLRESLVSMLRLAAFLSTVLDSATSKKPTREVKAHVKTLQRDIQSLTDHSTFISGKINFLLDAVLGMISIEQNAIIKIFSVVAVIFLPPTLVASAYGMNFRFMPELTWPYGYPVALGLMALSALIPVVYFRRKGWL